MSRIDRLKISIKEKRAKSLKEYRKKVRKENEGVKTKFNSVLDKEKSQTTPKKSLYIPKLNQSFESLAKNPNNPTYTATPNVVVLKEVDRSIKYLTYLKSPQWKGIRKQLFAKRGKKCEQCGAKKNIQVHHLTYARLYREKLSDLKILCGTCHKRVHGLIK